ncbi:MAG: hypothetical protein O6952_02870 [Planctomycetota bacterium]|nr:hypothetical protein [Planctomycetota bacterium]
MGLAALVLFHGVPALAQDDALKEILGDISTYQEIVEGIRGEKFKKDVPASEQSTKDFAKFVRKSMDEDMPPERLEGWSKALKLLGVLERDYDLREGLMEFVVTQAGAYYDPDSEAFYVVMGGLPKAILKTIVVHELHHALQDQLFDLEGMLDRAQKGENGDAESALTFLVEGEATYVMMLHQFNPSGMDPGQGVSPMVERMLRGLRKVNPTEMPDMGSMLGQGADGDMDSLKKAMQAVRKMPNFIVRSFSDPYMWGAYAIAKVHGEKGWDGVSELFRSPPASTEVLMHPGKLLRGDDPPVEIQNPDISSALGSGWSRTFGDTMGEHGILIILDEFLSPKKAAKEKKGDALEGLMQALMETSETPGETAAAGWGGDRYDVYESDRGRTALAWVTHWDQTKDAAEFFEAYRRAVKARFTSTELPSTAYRFRHVIGSDADTQNVFGALQDKDVIILIAPTSVPGEKTVDRLLGARRESK